MTSNDEEQFYLMLDNFLTAYGKEPKPTVFKFWFGLMQEFSLEECAKAMTKYAKTVKFPPVPAGVIELIAGSAEISPDEAWAHVPKLETDAGWMNKRMSKALGVALPLIEAGDKVAARMSFIASYKNTENDNEWFYSQAQGVPFETQESEKVLQHKQLESRGWVKPSENIDRLMIEMDKSPMLTSENKENSAKLLEMTKEIAGR